MGYVTKCPKGHQLFVVKCDTDEGEREFEVGQVEVSRDGFYFEDGGSTENEVVDCGEGCPQTSLDMED